MNKYKKKILLTTLLSVIVHFVILSLLLLIPNNSIKVTKPLIKQKYKLVIKNKKKKLKIKEKIKKPEDEVLNKQVVDISKPKNETTPIKTKYVARYNSRVKKETVAKRVDNITTQKPSNKNITIVKKKRKKKKIVKRQKKEKKEKRMNVLSQQEKEKTVKVKKEKANMKIKSGEEKEILKQVEKKAGKQKNGEKSFKKKEITFDYSDYNFSKMLRTSNDYLKNVEKGEITSLNTLANIYTGYFIKLKNRLSKEWNPIRSYTKNDPYRKRYGIKDRYTVLTVSIKKDGYLKKIKIKKSSGLKFLDEEAIRAFEMAQPYKIVPQGILKGRNFFTINFGFFVDNPSSTSVFYIK